MSKVKERIISFFLSREKKKVKLPYLVFFFKGRRGRDLKGF